MRDYLFLYGTLMPNEADDEVADVIKRLRRVGAAYVRGRLYNLGEFPGGVIDLSANTSIRGELVELPADKAVLDALDKYEEFDPSRPQKSLFVRKRTKIKLANVGMYKVGSMFITEIQERHRSLEGEVIPSPRLLRDLSVHD